jgi:hypothetical protein
MRQCTKDNIIRRFWQNNLKSAKEEHNVLRNQGMMSTQKIASARDTEVYLPGTTAMTTSEGRAALYSRYCGSPPIHLQEGTFLLFRLISAQLGHGWSMNRQCTLHSVPVRIRIALRKVVLNSCTAEGRITAELPAQTCNQIIPGILPVPVL